MEPKTETKAEKFLKFMTIGGGVVAAINTTIIPLGENLGFFCGMGYFAGKLTYDYMKNQNDDEAKQTFKNSAFIALGSLGAYVLAPSLPMTNLLEYGASIGIGTGVIGMTVVKVQEHRNKKPKM